MSDQLSHRAFVAYPSEPQFVSDAIIGAVGLSANKSLLLQPWQKMRILGLKIDNLTQEQISDTSCLIADVSVSNFNVYYEIGYALALQKPVVLTVNTAFSASVFNAKKTGLFDNVGWLNYQNADELSDGLDEWDRASWTERYEK